MRICNWVREEKQDEGSEAGIDRAGRKEKEKERARKAGVIGERSFATRLIQLQVQLSRTEQLIYPGNRHLNLSLCWDAVDTFGTK
ncbi:hypothetical protein EXN66_Car006041 [Channa argus]|uniref:Uncharacterized protein n=1 Tax=Channa argus TaxID=215402 RepID=A0A6G1PK47_CHAAH|nr:hypothetical protein EXN66_Car006041 [Channa argus]